MGSRTAFLWRGSLTFCLDPSLRSGWRESQASKCAWVATERKAAVISAQALKVDAAPADAEHQRRALGLGTSSIRRGVDEFASPLIDIGAKVSKRIECRRSIGHVVQERGSIVIGIRTSIASRGNRIAPPIEAASFGRAEDLSVWRSPWFQLVAWSGSGRSPAQKQEGPKPEYRITWRTERDHLLSSPRKRRPSAGSPLSRG
jgi:hypothetical protein